MHVNLVVEPYDWETPPTPEELADNHRNTTYYDWVRPYVLVRDDATPQATSAPANLIGATSLKGANWTPPNGLFKGLRVNTGPTS